MENFAIRRMSGDASVSRWYDPARSLGPVEPGGVAEQGDVGDQGRVDPLVPEQVGQDRLVVA